MGKIILPDKRELEFEGDAGKVSDGFHTFDELYKHRIELFIALCRVCSEEWTHTVWRSKLHSDGSSFGGWFLLGLNKKKGAQITYHLPLKRWPDTYFAETLAKAPAWDGHSPKDVLSRLKKL